MRDGVIVTRGGTSSGPGIYTVNYIVRGVVEGGFAEVRVGI